MVIQICVGSSCHIKGSPEIVELLTKAIEDHNLQDEVTLSGSFCIGVCNRLGVTVQVDDEVHTGINRENFREFFEEKVLSVIKSLKHAESSPTREGVKRESTVPLLPPGPRAAALPRRQSLKSAGFSRPTQVANCVHAQTPGRAITEQSASVSP